MNLSILTNDGEVKIRDLVNIIKMANQNVIEIYQDYIKKGDLDIQIKDDESPLTRADLVASETINNRLKKLYPNIPIVSEETKNEKLEIRKNYNYYWCIDPIDGTKEFIKKNGEFTINIGLIQVDKPVLGIVSIPVSGAIYFGVEGGGAYKVYNNSIERIYCRSPPDEPVIMVSRSHNNEATIKFLSRYNKYKINSKGSSLKFLEIAEGKADIYPRLNGSMEWDTAASHIIVTEAGGKIELLSDENKTLVYNKENLLNPYFVVRGNL